MKRGFLKVLCLAGVLAFMIPVIKVNASETNAAESEITAESKITAESEITAEYDNYSFKFEEKENLKENSEKLSKLNTQKVDSIAVYDREINNWVREFHSLKLADFNYLSNYEIYKYKKIEELSLEETLSYLTFIIRGEKFCDGNIAYYLENGTIEKLCNNL